VVSRSPIWLTGFIDLPAEHYDAGVAFWRAVTGYGISPPRGDQGEFATLIPPDGDPYLRVQRLAEGAPGLHLDLHHPDHEFQVFGSPAGFAYCQVSEALGNRPPPTVWPGGHRSAVDQLCIDIPPSRFDEECAFWAGALGRPLIEFPTAPEFLAVERPPGHPLRILLQRQDDEQPRATAHFDVSTDDRAAEARRHEALGATVVREHEWWTVLRDPVDAEYCLVDRTWRD
jgi:hypothetical protein